MAPSSVDETTALLLPAPSLRQDEADSIVESAVSKEERELAASAIGERLAYNDYTTIDWLHDLVKDSYRHRAVHAKTSLRYRFFALFDSCSGWVAVTIVGLLTAFAAFVVDVAEATVSDWKFGYCSTNPFLSREACCEKRTPFLGVSAGIEDQCDDFVVWTNGYAASFAIYVGWALAFGIISSCATVLTKRALLSIPLEDSSKQNNSSPSNPIPPAPPTKFLYRAAGSGIPEIKTILSGFVIPNFLDFEVLLAKGFGAVFAVATGMCLGKEGPFVHISTCVGYLVGLWFPKYRENSRKMRELLAAACASGLSVAFGAPIGGVLFSYEEISTYFPRKVLWRAFLCSLVAAITLKALNPSGTGKLVLFETNYGTSYSPVHYAVFVLLGVAGGIFGGVFCKCNFKWSKWFRTYPIIKNHPVLEVFLVVLATTLLQYPNPLTREPGDAIIKNLLVDCRDKDTLPSWVCQAEAGPKVNGAYVGWLVYGTAVKLVLTIITFGCKVPSGVIIPALDAGAFFGRLIGQLVGTISPGIFAMVGAAAFLAGVSRMTISLCVIMFELTGELEYIIPHMIAILVAKWTADFIGGREGVYDLAQNVLGHPFLDHEHAIQLVQSQPYPLLVEELIPPPMTMSEITVDVPKSNCVSREELQRRLALLKRRGLMDAGLVLVQDGMLQGYISEGELEFGLANVGAVYARDASVRLLGNPAHVSPDEHNMELDTGHQEELDLSVFVDRTPAVVCAKAPLEYAVEMFGKLGLRHLCIVEEGTSRLVGVVIKKRLVGYLESLGH